MENIQKATETHFLELIQWILSHFPSGHRRSETQLCTPTQLPCRSVTWSTTNHAQFTVPRDLVFPSGEKKKTNNNTPTTTKEENSS